MNEMIKKLNNNWESPQLMNLLINRCEIMHTMLTI